MESFVIIGDISLNEYVTIYNNKAKNSKAINSNNFINDLINYSNQINMSFSLITSPLLDDVGNEYVKKIESNKVRVFFPSEDKASPFSLIINQKNKNVISMKTKKDLDSITPLFLKSIKGAFKNSNYIFISTKLPFNTLNYIFEEYKDRRIIFYCENEDDYKKMYPYISKAFLILVNIHNVKKMLNYNNNQPTSRYVDTILKKKVHSVCLFGKNEDIYYGVEDNIFFIERNEKIKNNDNDTMYAKFASALIFKLINDGSIHEAISVGNISINEK